MTRILLAEDSPTQAEHLRMILEENGFAVDVTPDVEQALRRFSAEAYDVVISDIIMPGMSGYDLCRELKASGRNVPVILLSSLGDPMDIVRGLECGADNYLIKPCDPKQLVSRIRSVVANRELRTAPRNESGIELVFLGKKFLVNSTKEQILDLLIATFEDIIRTNRELQESKAELSDAKGRIELYAQELEARVEERTQQLAAQQKQLAQAQKMEAIGQLTGGIAHDFNNLLMVIMSNAESLQDELPDMPRLRNFAGNIMKAGERGADLVRQLLMFARKQELRPKVIDVNALIDSMAKLLKHALQENIVIDLRKAERPALVNADPGQLENALLNLAVNARDAMPAGGRITIATSLVSVSSPPPDDPELKPGKYVRTSVTDTGTGMPKEVIDHAFEPFFTTKEAGKGTGLGLSMVYGFVKQSAGHIKIRSEINAGTTISIFLNEAAAANAARPETLKAAPVPAGHGRILLVEDDELVRSSIVERLSEFGYTVTAVETAQEALRKLQQQPGFELVFSDVIMPGPMNGAELVGEVRRNWPEIKVMLTSGYAGTAMPGKIRLPPDVRVLAKPYSNAELARAIQQVLAGGNIQ